MPFVNVKLATVSMTAEQKEQIIAGMSDVLYNVLGKKPETTYVLIEEFPSDNCGARAA